MDYDKLALELHQKYGGKITTSLRDLAELDRTKLSAYYTPGVASVCLAIADDESKLATYSWTNNLVAVISDGSAVLGLGDIGPKASMPVMEGKALLFKHFAGVDAVPIVLDVHTADDIVSAVKAIAPSFGAINLEDISAPKCFEVEERLKQELGIPVFHDDQHGTAIVVLAGLINALKITNQSLDELKIVIVGAGAAGVAIAKLIESYSQKTYQNTPNKGVKMYAIDSKGVISSKREDLNESKTRLLEFTNKDAIDGSLADVIKDANVFIGVSGPGVLTTDHIKSMAPDPIIFALSNPTPEIMPDVAIDAGAKIIATGRSDFPNQINNAIAFPGIFRGALDNQVKAITNEHKLLVAETIASLVESPTNDCIIPSVFDERLVPSIADCIK